ncbi:MAG TPA: hypothetical protein VKN74_01300 [Candidatus Mcinerneyibacterium sp.]|nr:hypothetical protein [Candidatus Mcinerneyibacterium sp.]
MVLKKIKVSKLKNKITLKCPNCGTLNTFTFNNKDKFLYCSNCKYVYAWIENQNLLYEKKDKSKSNKKNH